MHAFDLDRLDTQITVRMAQPDDRLVLLDGQEVELDADTLVIADASGPVAMAGAQSSHQSPSPARRDATGCIPMHLIVMSGA
jgi:phenylalanyl-tRNA synthetase beta chain